MAALPLENYKQRPLRATEYSNLGQMYVFGHQFTFRNPKDIEPYAYQITAKQLIHLIDTRILTPVDINRAELIKELGLSDISPLHNEQ